MPMVRVSVIETLERVIEVEADSIQDAVDEVQKMYDDQEIVLETRYRKCTTIRKSFWKQETSPDMKSNRLHGQSGRQSNKINKEVII